MVLLCAAVLAHGLGCYLKTGFFAGRAGFGP